MSNNHKGKRRVAVPAVVTAGIGSILLAFSLTPAFSAAVAKITNDTDTAGTGTLTMQETNDNAGAPGAVKCNSTDGAGGMSNNIATCSSINKYGGNLKMIPGQTVSTTIHIINTGNVDAATFTLTPGACTQSAISSPSGSATTLCDKMNITLKKNGLAFWTGTATALAAHGDFALGAVTAGTDVPFTFDVQLDPSADATFQNLQISQPLTWTFNS